MTREEFFQQFPWLRNSMPKDWHPKELCSSCKGFGYTWEQPDLLSADQAEICEPCGGTGFSGYIEKAPRSKDSEPEAVKANRQERAKIASLTPQERKVFRI
jgi:DnaJ-class molecular chaperone